MPNYFEHFIIANSTYNFEESSPQANYDFDSSEFCSTISLSRDFCGKLQLIFVYQNNLLIKGIDKVLTTIIYAEPIAPELYFPNDYIVPTSFLVL